MSGVMLFGLAVFLFVFGILPYWFKVHKHLSEILGCTCSLHRSNEILIAFLFRLGSDVPQRRIHCNYPSSRRHLQPSIVLRLAYHHGRPHLHHVARPVFPHNDGLLEGEDFDGETGGRRDRLHEFEGNRGDGEDEYEVRDSGRGEGTREVR